MLIAGATVAAVVACTSHGGHGDVTATAKHDTVSAGADDGPEDSGGSATLLDRVKGDSDDDFAKVALPYAHTHDPVTEAKELCDALNSGNSVGLMTTYGNDNRDDVNFAALAVNHSCPGFNLANDDLGLPGIPTDANSPSGGR